MVLLLRVNYSFRLPPVSRGEAICIPSQSVCVTERAQSPWQRGASIAFVLQLYQLQTGRIVKKTSPISS